MEHYALASQVYGVALIFARLGAFFMSMPGLSESFTPSTPRLGFSLLVSIALFPTLSAGMPGEPASLFGMTAQLVSELVIGLALGVLLRLFMAALAVAGEIISLQTTLSFAQTTNPLQAQPTTSVTTFLTIFGLTTIFASGLHLFFIAGIVHSYAVFPAGHGVPMASFNTLFVQTLSEVYELGVQMSAPVIVFSLVFNIATGLIARVMPQFQIFALSSPLSVLLGLSLLSMCLGGLGVVWTDHYRNYVERWF